MIRVLSDWSHTGLKWAQNFVSYIFFFQNLLELFFLEEENTEQSHWNCWHWGCTTIRNASGRHSTARTKQHHSLFWSMSPLVREANVLPLHFIKAYIHTCCGGEGYGWITRTDAQPPTHQWTPCVLWDGAISSFEKNTNCCLFLS